PHDVREKLVRSSATPGCLIPSVMGFVEQGQGQPITGNGQRISRQSADPRWQIKSIFLRRI
ncbi:hypothetical protein ACUXQ2_002528, partial [Cupriavidus metallidurans]